MAIGGLDDAMGMTASVHGERGLNVDTVVGNSKVLLLGGFFCWSVCRFALRATRHDHHNIAVRGYSESTVVCVWAIVAILAVFFTEIYLWWRVVLCDLPIFFSHDMLTRRK